MFYDFTASDPIFILILTLGNKLPQDVLNPAHGIISKGERSFPTIKPDIITHGTQVFIIMGVLWINYNFNDL